jgi:uncharacterized protein (TIGR02996 family)
MTLADPATEFAGYPVINYNPAMGIPLPVLPRRELRLWDHNKCDQFWAITLERDRHTIQSGTIGTEGETTTTEFPSPEDAQASYRKLLAEKVAAHYLLPAIRREFHLIEGASRKLWEITLLARSQQAVAVRSGTFGPARKSEFARFDSLETARDACEQLIAEKVAQGYTEKLVDAGSLVGALCAAVVANPDDRASRMALADYLNEQGEQPHPVAYRVTGEGSREQLEALLADPFVGLVQAIVIGYCYSDDGSGEVAKALIRARDRLRHLRALFVGDIPSTKQEISWLHQSDLTDLLAAFPQLEHFQARGGTSLALRPFEHEHLESLTFEASNLPREVVQAIGKSSLPALEHLEIWLGTSEYGADTTVADLKDLLTGKAMPALRYLGLRNGEIADDIAEALANSPLLERLHVLDLSLGTLGDCGATALLANPAVARLEKLDIHHHYVSPALVERLEALGISVDASDVKQPDDPDDPEHSRYVAHAE